MNTVPHDPEVVESEAIVPKGGDWLAMTNSDPVGGLVVQRHMVVRVMREVMREGTHYGTIPGTPKPTLYKGGAELLNVMFRLAPKYEKETERWDGAHLFVRYRCILVHIPTGQPWGEGIGSCSTMESKYRYRNDKSFEVTDLPIPKDAKEKRAEYFKQGYGMKKVDEGWKWVRFTGDGKIENPDLADTYNTVDKMACKRALVAAVLNSTGASDTFTQDMEDFHPAYEPPTPEPIPAGQTGQERQKAQEGAKDRAQAQGRAAPESRATQAQKDSQGRPVLKDGAQYQMCPQCGKEAVVVGPEGQAVCRQRAGGCEQQWVPKVWAIVSVPGPSSIDPVPTPAKHEAPADIQDLTDSDLPF